MKSKLTSALLVLTLALTVLSTTTFSATLNLTKIGALDLAGKTFSEWWYTGINPTFTGEADANAEVTVTIDDEVFTGDADAEGDFAIATTADEGQHHVVVESEGESYDFTLNLGEDFPGTSETTSSTGSVPQTGLNQTTAVFLGLGISLLALYFYFSESNKKHKVFEKNIISDK